MFVLLISCFNFFRKKMELFLDINDEERFPNDPFFKIGQSNQLIDVTLKVDDLDLNRKDDQDHNEKNHLDMNEPLPSPPPTPTYNLSHEVSPPSPMDSEWDDVPYLHPQFLNLKSPSFTRENIETPGKEQSEISIVKEVVKSKNERNLEKFRIIFHYLSMKTGVVEDPTYEDWQIIKTPVWVGVGNKVYPRRGSFAKNAPSKRSCKRLLINRVIHPKIIVNISSWDARVGNFMMDNLQSMFKLMQAPNHADFYKRTILVLYASMYAIYPRGFEWRHPFSLATVSLQPGDGTKARYQQQKKQKKFNEMVAQRLPGGRCTARIPLK